MNRDSAIDYWAYTLFRAFGILIRLMPLPLVFFLAKCLGSLFYYLDSSHRPVVYANIKTAFGATKGPLELAGIAKRFYQAFAQNFIEIFLLPLADDAYLKKYLAIEGVDNIVKGFKKGNGVILAVVHEGDWEFSNIICASLGFPFVLIINERRYQRLNRIIGKFRVKENCTIVSRDRGLPNVIQALKNNQMVVATVDQGGKTGIGIDFFGREASMSTGAAKLAVKYDAAILPVYFTRLKGPYVKVVIGEAMEIKKTGDLEKDMRVLLQELAHIFERIITRYPQEHLWAYKIWKYSRKMNILVLSDGKAGHLASSMAAAQIAVEGCAMRDIEAKVEVVEIKFRNKLSAASLMLSACLADKYSCQGCLWCLRRFLAAEVYPRLIDRKYDIIISCGGALAPVNYVLSQENLAKSVVIMRPSFLNLKRFDLAIIPEHDLPPKMDNVAACEGALNRINPAYLKEQSARLASSQGLNPQGFYIGLLLGGGNKKFQLKKESVREVIGQVKRACEKTGAEVLVTTSRRTSAEVEKLVKEEFRNYPRAKLLVIANERNIPGVVAGILGLSGTIVISPESISMISEAAGSKKYIFVFKGEGLGRRHLRFLENFSGKKYIYLVDASALGKEIEGIRRLHPPVYSPQSNLSVTEEIRKLI